MRRLLSRLRDAYRAQGPQLPLVAARWLVRPEYLVIVRDLGRGTPTFEARDDVRWAPLGEADLPALLEISPTLTEADVRRLWAEGQECLTAWIGDTPVFYRWDSAGPSYLPYLDRTFLPRPGDLLLSQVFTHPAYRTRGLLSASSALVVPRARERGARRVVALVAWWNRPTLHVARDKYRHTVAGTVGYWHLGPWRRYFTTGLVRLDGHGGIRVDEPPGG
jgi:GNAT superfamily N-acetyltransferase